MRDDMNAVTVSGKIATHDKAPYWGLITIDAATGLIKKVEKTTGLAKADHMFGKDCLIFPGFGDVHIHAREDDTGTQVYKEDYTTASKAAHCGGVAHVCAMPNTPNPVTGKRQFAWHRARVREIGSPVVILNYVGIDTKTKPLGKPDDHIYKLYFGKSVGDLTVMYGSELDDILARYRGQRVSFHVEYEPIVQMSAAGKTHSDRRPVACVEDGLQLLLPLIQKYKIKAKLCHWSTGGKSFAMIAEYRRRGCDIMLEVSPLHLLFDTSMTDADPSLWTKVQMNPAIQAPEHRSALIKGLKDGFIQFLATDHAPHTEEEKFSAFARFTERYPGQRNKDIAESIKKENRELYNATCMENNHSGAPWLDTYAIVCAWLINEQAFKPRDIARVASYHPGVFVNRQLARQFPKTDFGKGFGVIAKGYLGTLTVLDLAKTVRVERACLGTKAGWSPLEGRTMRGGLEALFIRGVRQ